MKADFRGRVVDGDLARTLIKIGVAKEIKEKPEKVDEVKTDKVKHDAVVKKTPAKKPTTAKKKPTTKKKPAQKKAVKKVTPDSKSE